MKVWTTLWIAMAVGMVGVGCEKEAVPAAGGSRGSAATGAVVGKEIGMGAEGVVVDGKTIPVPCTKEQLTAVLGEASRTVETPSKNNIMVWDEKGIFVYFRPGTATSHAVAVAFGKQGLEFWPNKLFSGSVRVDGKLLTGTSGAAELKASGFTEDQFIPILWQKVVGKLTIIANTDATSVTFLTLEEPVAK